MNVLVTGGAGFIGGQIVLELSRLKINTIVIDNLSNSSERYIPKNVKLYKCNIGDKQLVKKVILDNNINIVIHLAAFTDVAESILKPYEYYENNVSQSLEFFETCIKNGIKKIIFSSTAACYGPNNNKNINENNLLKPDTPYGNSKLMCERILQDYSLRYDINYLIFRYFNVAGADPKNEIGRVKKSTHLISKICTAFLDNKKIMNIYGNDYDTPDGTCIRDFIHVSDVAKAHIQGINYLNKGNVSHIINLGYGIGFSVMETILEAQKTTKIKLSIDIQPRRKGDIARVVADNSKAKKVLKWQPKYNNLGQIIKHQYKWTKKIYTNFKNGKYDI